MPGSEATVVGGRLPETDGAVGRTDVGEAACGAVGACWLGPPQPSRSTAAVAAVIALRTGRVMSVSSAAAFGPARSPRHLAARNAHMIRKITTPATASDSNSDGPASLDRCGGTEEQAHADRTTNSDHLDVSIFQPAVY